MTKKKCKNCKAFSNYRDAVFGCLLDYEQENLLQRNENFIYPAEPCC